MPARLALKIDVDTDRGTRVGVPNLLADLREFGVPACFLFSLGPDQTGRAISRIFRPGFFQKVSRTSVVQLYGVRTLLNGTLLPAPHIGRRNEAVLRSVQDAGFETGIHCHNHYRWQDHVQTMAPEAVQQEFDLARSEYRRIFGTEANTAGAPGWQANANSRAAYDQAGLLYSSDTRGRGPHFVRTGGRAFTTLEIPSTLPTLDELLGRPEYPDARIVPHLLTCLNPTTLNVFTLHAELEGMGKRSLFREFLAAIRQTGVQVVSPEQAARQLLARPQEIPCCEMLQAPVDGRSGLLAVQGPAVDHAAASAVILDHKPAP